MLFLQRKIVRSATKIRLIKINLSNVFCNLSQICPHHHHSHSIHKIRIQKGKKNQIFSSQKRKKTLTPTIVRTKKMVINDIDEFRYDLQF